jgi:ribose transport system substrate-binding protein
MKKIIVVLLCLAILLPMSLAGCKPNEVAPTQAPEKPAEATPTQAPEKPAESGEIDLGIVPLMPDGKYILPIQAAGPKGEEVVGIEEVLKLLDADDIKKIKEGNFTAAICMADSGNDWAQGQIKGITETLEKFNVKLVASTDAKWKVEQQIADIESVIQLKPSVIFSHPTDGIAMGPSYKKAADAGIKIVFIDSQGANSTFPQDYAGIVQADNYAIARAAAEILAEKIGEEGEVALINYKNSVPHMDMRERAAKETFAKYPNIKVVADQKVGSNEEGAAVAESIMIANPNVKAIWVGWDGPAMVAAAALDSIGKKVFIAAPDLGRDAAYSIASNGLFIGSGAQHPWDQGVAAAVIGMTALAGKETPQYVIVPGEKVTKENLKDAWDKIYHSAMPKEIEEALNK